MSKKKSLGSSPVGYSDTGTSTFSFIPDLGVAEKNVKETDNQELPKGNSSNGTPNKTVVSYYLEEPLTERVRRLAEDLETTYSAIAGRALDSWISRHGY
ncbi:MAG: hypothetical protein ACOC4S_02065 [Balneolaceae bacterium]